jgi:hypothetical protein
MTDGLVALALLLAFGGVCYMIGRVHAQLRDDAWFDDLRAHIERGEAILRDIGKPSNHTTTRARIEGEGTEA